MNQGVGAGSKAMAYRAGLASDTAASSAPTPDNAYLQAIARDMQSRAEFDASLAQERRGIMDSLLDTDATARTSDLAARDDAIFSDLSRQDRLARERMMQYQRGSGLFGAVAGLFS